MAIVKNSLLLYCCGFCFLCLLAVQVSASENSQSMPVWQMDFSLLDDMNESSTREYLLQSGVEFAIDSEVIQLSISEGRLLLETSTADTLLMVIAFYGKETGDKRVKASLAEINWGVDRFPQGADWENGVNRVAIDLLFVLGTEKFSSGLPFGINSAPYFLSPFIGKKEQVGKMYLGRLYREAGRYYCMSNDTGEQLTRFNLREKFIDEFEQHYKKPGMPEVTGIGIQMNTKDTTGGARAFIKSINLYP